VSPLWPDTCVAVLTPDRAVLARTRRGLRAQLEPLAEARCTGAHPRAQAEALALLLAAPGLRRGGLRIVLSSHLVRLWLLPCSAEIGTPSERAEFAAICCDETFGSEPGGRRIVSARARPPSPRVTAAVDSALLAGLRDAASGSPLRLASVQPYLGAAFDRLRQSLPRRDFVFLLAEPTRSCVLTATGGRWRSLRNVGCSGQPHALAQLLQREAQLSGLADEGMPPVFVHAPGGEPLNLPPCHGVLPLWLPLPGGAPEDPLLAMAKTVA